MPFLISPGRPPIGSSTLSSIAATPEQLTALVQGILLCLFSPKGLATRNRTPNSCCAITASTSGRSVTKTKITPLGKWLASFETYAEQGRQRTYTAPLHTYALAGEPGHCLRRPAEFRRRIETDLRISAKANGLAKIYRFSCKYKLTKRIDFFCPSS
jgi:hypothetical protein